MNTKKFNYNSWPLGKLPKDFQRPEPELIRQLGYEWDDPRDIVDIWEKKVAHFAESKYAVAVDCCSHAIFLSLQYLLKAGIIDYNDEIICPQRTYVSVPMQIVHAGLFVKFQDIEWRGVYQLPPSNIWDAGLRWTKGMYIKDSLMCLSFQIKKRIPIGRGGMILTDNKDAYDWFTLARYDGRDMSVPYPDENHIRQVGWHMYQTPEDCARGILLMDKVPLINDDAGGYELYSDLSKTFKKL